MSASRRLLKTVFHCNTTALIRVPLACVQTEAWVSVPSSPLCWGEFQQRGSRSPSSVALPGRKAGRQRRGGWKGQKGRLAQPLQLTSYILGESRKNLSLEITNYLFRTPSISVTSLATPSTVWEKWKGLYILQENSSNSKKIIHHFKSSCPGSLPVEREKRLGVWSALI